ncbi:MAG: hypothetical protein IT560_11595 [Alphaproteobacteria bacterium]|nr:hypothetical protein [Alphaproteobacteria bacterium]
MNIDYKLTGLGWAECAIEINRTQCTTTASYLSDCLKYFIDATCSILKGNDESRFSFDEEPGEYRWILHSLSENTVKITIIAFAELWGEMADSDGTVIFQAETSKHSFATELKAALDRLLVLHGVEGYKEKWNEHEFPIISYQELCKLLKVSTELPPFKPPVTMGYIK